MLKILYLKISLLNFANLIVCASSISEFTYYGNMGPDHWSEHYNQCSGKHQSPININDVDVVNRTFTKMLFNEFHKPSISTSVFNNGHTVLVKMTFDKDAPSIAEGPLEGKGVYQFQQLHFHWGEDNTVGSEDRINDIAYPMELHIVFRNSKYESIDAASRADDGIAVLAAFFEVINSTSNEYDLLTSHLEHIHASSQCDTTTVSEFIHEDVIWIDFINPIGISEEMIERFRYLKTFDGTSLTHNFRPVQPLNNRKVYRSVREDIDLEPDNPSVIDHIPLVNGLMNENSSSNLSRNCYSSLIVIFSIFAGIQYIF
ncbi:hypothetical protein DOY81_010960 [Sarcophaga bullata]|nr:hypothetical protein DOY81_010960 [Sarcophaga bullata]